MRVTTARVIILTAVFGLLSASSGLSVVTEAEVIIVKGSVTAKPPSATESVAVLRGHAITVGSRIETGTMSDLLMSPFPSSAIRVLENNSVDLTETDLQKSGETILGRKARLQLTKGTVQVALEKLPNSTMDFKVTTPQCVAAARGTIFGTSCSGGSTTTIVADGTVAMPWVDAKGKIHNVDVKAGMKMTVKETPQGLSQIGPEHATKAELKELGDFARDAAQSGLISLLPIGELTESLTSLNPGAAGAPVPLVLPPESPSLPELPEETIVTPP